MALHDWCGEFLSHHHKPTKISHSTEVKFMIEFVHLLRGDLIALVGVQSRHEHVDLLVWDAPLPVTPADDLPHSLPTDDALMLGVVLLEQSLHCLPQLLLSDICLPARRPLLDGGAVVGDDSDCVAAVGALGRLYVESWLIATHFCYRICLFLAN